MLDGVVVSMSHTPAMFSLTLVLNRQVVESLSDNVIPNIGFPTRGLEIRSENATHIINNTDQLLGCMYQ